MNIPLVDLKAQYHPLKEEILYGMEQVLEGMHLFLGENVQAFEQEFAAVLRRPARHRRVRRHQRAPHHPAGHGDRGG